MKPTTRFLAQISSACRFCGFVVLLLVCQANRADEPFVLPVWPGAVPEDYGTIGPERIRAPSEAPTKNAKWITNVSNPTITIFRPARDKDTGTAIIIEQERAGVEIRRDVPAPYIRIPKETPPILLVPATDDPVAGAENSVVMYLALKRANVAAELHVYAQGGHGFGVRKSTLPCSTWPDRCVAWLQNQGLLGTNATGN